MSEPEAVDPPERDRDLYTGIAQGGPAAISGREFSVRYPEGFLAVNRAAGTAVVYRYQPEERSFVAGEVEELDQARLDATTHEPRFDVISYG